MVNFVSQVGGWLSVHKCNSSGRVIFSGGISGWVMPRTVPEDGMLHITVRAGI